MLLSAAHKSSAVRKAYNQPFSDDCTLARPHQWTRSIEVCSTDNGPSRMDELFKVLSRVYVVFGFCFYVFVMF